MKTEQDSSGNYHKAAAGIVMLLALIASGILVVTHWHGMFGPTTTATELSTPSAAHSPTSAEPQAADPHDNEFVAVALSPSGIAKNSPTPGGYGTSGTRANADKIAISFCSAHNSDCILVGDAFHGCVAYAVSPDLLSFGAGVATTKDDAEANAAGQLYQASGKHAADSYVKCSLPPPGVGI